MKAEPKFVPKPGQVDFSEARFAPVINCIVKHGRKILLVERSSSMRLYPGYWNGISGFLDDQKSLEDKVAEELREELGIRRNQIESIQLGNIFHQEEKKYKKTWIVHPVLVTVATERVVLDWEARRCAWVLPKNASQYRLLPGFDRVLQAVSKIRTATPA